MPDSSYAPALADTLLDPNTDTGSATDHPAPSPEASVAPTLTKRRIEWARLDWPVVIGIAAMHVGCIAAPFFFSWSGLVLALVFTWVTGGVGITLCYHRLLTHHSFKTPKWFEYFLTTLGCLAWQGGPIQWVGVHRIHHAHSDMEGDPHTPRHGFGWAHMFWCMQRTIAPKPAAEAAKDLARDPGHRFLNRYFWVPQFAFALLVIVGGEVAKRMGMNASGLSWFLWAVCVRTVLCYHGTWFVNSATHTWGYRNFKTKDGSTNLWWVALVAFGEGWHNNHHAHQRSAAHGLRWYELDQTYWLIKMLSWVGLARDIVKPSPDQMPT